MEIQGAKITKQKAITLFSLITAFRLFLAYFFPITGDEAYFYRWGQYPSAVYYDHPGLTGWWMWLAQFLGHHIFFSRLLPLAVGGFIAWGIYSIVQDLTKDKNKALIAAILYYTTPMSLLSVLISTDTPLVLFVFLSGWFFLRSFRHREIPSYVCSAVCLGLAFWSKYLMFFMVWSLLFCAVVCLRELKKKILYIGILGGVGIFFIASHFYWSSQNCWWSVVFNFINRESETEWKWNNLITYILFLFYLTTPWLLSLAIKKFKDLSFISNPPLKAAWLMYALPLALLALPSISYPNLHWLIAYIPFIFIALSSMIDINFLKYLRYNLIFTGVHMVFLTALLLLPDHYFSSNKFYNDIVMGKYGNEIETALEKYKKDYVFGTIGYTTSGLMQYHNQRHYLVFNDKDNNGRSDDKWTDYRKLDGKNILLISTYKYKPLELEEYKNYFTEIVYEDLNIRGATFYIARGHSFRYQNYQSSYLTWVKDQYYKIPSFLPAGRCFFFENYFSLATTKETL